MSEQLKQIVDTCTRALIEAGMDVKPEGGGEDHWLFGVVAAPEHEDQPVHERTHAVLAISRRNVPDPADLPPQ